MNTYRKPTQRMVADELYRAHFAAFTHGAFAALNPGQNLVPNWHIDALCHRIEQMLRGGQPRRLVINQPPRTLKSFIVSVALPAWLLAHDPTTRIICASYSDDLAAKFSRDCRALLETAFYRRLFPRTRLNPKKAAEREFETTARGYRLATSVGGTLTGRGGSVLVIDDPLKASDAGSELARRAAVEWFRGTALSRLDDRKHAFLILAMQRLHADDLSSTLIAQNWPSFVLPAIAVEPADYPIGDNELYHRAAGELLQPERDSHEEFDQLKNDLGSHVFAAQYQQNPTPPEGNMIKAEWLRRYEAPPVRQEFARVVLCCDPALKAGAHNDFTAIMVIGVQEKKFHVLAARRGHWTVVQMREQIIACATEFAVDLVIVEETASGVGLIQLLQEKTQLTVIGRKAEHDKVTRLYQHQGRFEAGQILLPNEAPWLADFEAELLAFPQGRYDDQVDALLLFLDWLAKNQWSLKPQTFATPIVITRNDLYPGEPWRGYTDPWSVPPWF